MAREPLRAEVEVDETWGGGTQADLQRSRQLKGRKVAAILVAMENAGAPQDALVGCVIPECKSATLIAFPKQNVQSGPS